jgi:hypothetical protein
MWCCVEPERIDKTTPIMQAMAEGFGGEVIIGPPPDDGSPFAIWGQQWMTLDLLPRAIREKRPFLHIDNGYINSAKGGLTGYYRITYRGLSPVLLRDPPAPRFDVAMAPWRRIGRHVLLALPGAGFGRAIGLDMGTWIHHSQTVLRRSTRRPIIVRPKKSGRTIPADMQNCWAVVTHSSNVAVDALLCGVPVFVAPNSPAAPVGNLTLADLERPAMPERETWLASLIAQQFTLGEMRSGLARDMMMKVVAQVDGAHVASTWLAYERV